MAFRNFVARKNYRINRKLVLALATATFLFVLFVVRFERRFDAVYKTHRLISRVVKAIRNNHEISYNTGALLIMNK